MRKIIHAELYSGSFNEFNQLVKDYSSAYRYAFCRFQKDKLEFNGVRNRTKALYASLNTRQISDATNQAKQLYMRVGDNKVVFGGKKLQEKLQKQQITAKEWQDKRDNQIYSRGDATKKGNPTIRILNENELRVTIGNRQFITYKLFTPSKYVNNLQELLQSGIAYNIRLLRKDEKHFRIVIDYEVETPIQIVDFSKGIIGIDTNPDRIAVCETNEKGQFIDSYSIIDNKLFFANTNKREYTIGCIVQQIIKYALENSKGISFENLNFKREFEGCRKWNRIKSNFTYRKFLDLLERKCIEYGIKYRKVNPAFTSKIGRIKYQQMYNLNIHESAAYVIARRGLGLNESLSVYKHKANAVKSLVLDYAKNKTKRLHSWYLWRLLVNNYKAVLTALQTGISNLKELESNVCYEGEIPSG